MDIENKKPKRKYVEIQIKDPGEFTDVALLVDSDYFIDEIEIIRNKYGLAYDFPATDNSLAADFERKLHRSSTSSKDFDADVEKIRKRFNRPPHFKPVIEAAIIGGIIIDGIYSRAYLEEQETFSTENPEEIPDEKHSIVVHAGTREEDVLRVLREFKEKVRINFRGSEKERSDYKFGYWVDLSLQKMKDTSDAIDALHKWHISGKKPLELARIENGYTSVQYKELVKMVKRPPEKCSETDQRKNEIKLNSILSRRNSIKEQLRRYRKLL